MSTPATTATPTCGARPDPKREGRFVPDAICAQPVGHSGTHCALSLDGTVTAFHYVRPAQLQHGLRTPAVCRACGELDPTQSCPCQRPASKCEHEDVGADMHGTFTTFCCQRVATKRLVGRNDCELALLCDEHGAAALDAVARDGYLRHIALVDLRRERRLGAQLHELQRILFDAEERVTRLDRQRADLDAQLDSARAQLRAADVELQSFMDDHTPEECGL
jgi:hypothetical protein